MVARALTIVALLVPAASAFTTNRVAGVRSSVRHAARMSAMDEQPAVARRAILGAAALVVGQALAPSPALAMNEDKFRAQLKGYGLPSPPKIPDGFFPVLEVYGKAKAATNDDKASIVLDPLLVSFNSPNSWLVQRPNIDVNGEDGTISAGDYGKGDSAAFFVTSKKGSFDENNKQYLAEVIYEGLTQKAAVIQNLKVKKARKLESPDTEATYIIVDYTYELITGAGFEIARKGVGSVTTVGNKVEAMITASTDIRYKKVEGALQEIAQSFRVYDKVRL